MVTPQSCRACRAATAPGPVMAWVGLKKKVALVRAD